MHQHRRSTTRAQAHAGPPWLLVASGVALAALGLFLIGSILAALALLAVAVVAAAVGWRLLRAARRRHAPRPERGEPPLRGAPPLEAGTGASLRGMTPLALEDPPRPDLIRPERDGGERS